MFKLLLFFGADTTQMAVLLSCPVAVGYRYPLSTQPPLLCEHMTGSVDLPS